MPSESLSSCPASADGSGPASHVSGEKFDPESVRCFRTEGDVAFTFNVGVWHIAPRALDGQPAKVINVQGSRYMEHTELIDFEELTGTAIEVEL